MKKNIIVSLIVLALVSSFAIALENNTKDYKDYNINKFKVLQADKVVKNNDMINILKLNEEMEVKLYENPSTGYLWEITVEGEKDIISYTTEFVKDENLDTNKPIICGEGMDKLYKIKGLKEGTIKFKLELKRSFEKDKEAIETREYIIKVEK
ncbi:protease inhibitor I42 family protein [Peptostreptococcaceae bacterium AGR-M142]